MNADMGGTEILEPLQHAIDLKTYQDDGVNYKKKIFLLTDGEVSQPEKVVQAAKDGAQAGKCKVHTFGIGSGCSVSLVKRAA